MNRRDSQEHVTQKPQPTWSIQNKREISSDYGILRRDVHDDALKGSIAIIGIFREKTDGIIIIIGI